MTLSYGEIFAISNGVVDVFKKKIMNRRVPVEETESSNHATLEREEEEEIPVTHYSCPLDYIKLSINGTNREALLDTGLMVNLMPKHLVFSSGIWVPNEVYLSTWYRGEVDQVDEWSLGHFPIF
jgi:hypothetical protein